jgi:hypothetical protein
VWVGLCAVARPLQLAFTFPEKAVLDLRIRQVNLQKNPHMSDLRWRARWAVSIGSMLRYTYHPALLSKLERSNCTYPLLPCIQIQLDFAPHVIRLPGRPFASASVLVPVHGAHGPKLRRRTIKSNPIPFRSALSHIAPSSHSLPTEPICSARLRGGIIQRAFFTCRRRPKKKSSKS